MSTLLGQGLSAAVGEGIISDEQASRLLSFLVARENAASAVGTGRWSEEPVSPVEETEMPRFVRGFHDILITLGIIILLSGIAGLVDSAVILLPTILLAELLVRRQRLALPAFTLTLAFAAGLTMLNLRIQSYLYIEIGEPGATTFLIFALGYALGFVPFYWRYRVPVALAAMIALTAGSLMFMAASATEAIIYGPGPSHPTLLMCFALGAALVGLLLALRFDLSDPNRVTRRSDVAFWLHLVTAPALLYSSLALIFQLRGFDEGWDIRSMADSQPGIVVAVVCLFLLFGLVMDRRAFVTSSLLSLGFSVGSLVASRLSEFGTTFPVVLLLVGVIVLTIGVFWLTLRRALVTRLPESLQKRLPPLRSAG